MVKLKPPQVFLDGIRVGQDGQIILDGKAETKESVFEFETKLKGLALLKSPLFKNI